MKRDSLTAERFLRAASPFSPRALEALSGGRIIVTPTTVLPPFDVAMRYPEEINGRKFGSYFDWAAATFVISLIGCPALSLPCGFTRSGLPVGLQMIGLPRSEGRLLAFARELEEIFAVSGKLPLFENEKPAA